MASEENYAKAYADPGYGASPPGYPGMNAPSEKPSVHIQLSVLRGHVDRLVNSVSELVGRMDPVLRPSPTGLGAVGPDSIASSPVAREIAELAGMVERICGQIETARANLDV